MNADVKAIERRGYRAFEVADLTPAQCRHLLAYLEAQPQILQAWAFGSRPQRRARPDSDLDITVRLADPTKDDDWHDEEVGSLIEHSSRWSAQLTALLGITVKDIYLEYDPGRVGDRQGRDHGILLIDRIGAIYPDMPTSDG